MSSFSIDTRSISSSPLVNSLVKSRVFSATPDINEPPFKFIDTMDLSVVDTMLHGEIWAVWRPQVERKKVWCFLMQQFNSCTHTAWCADALSCWNMKSLPDTLCIAGSSMMSLWRPEAASEKWVRDITSISYFVTTIKLLHTLQVYSTVFVKKCMRLHFSR